MFMYQSRARIMPVHYQLTNVKKDRTSTIDYFQRIKGFVDTLATINRPLNDFEFISYLLARLGQQYDPFEIMKIKDRSQR